jgi:prepilin-type processing-associated H-X9-DG protein
MYGVYSSHHTDDPGVFWVSNGDFYGINLLRVKSPSNFFVCGDSSGVVRNSVYNGHYPDTGAWNFASSGTTQNLNRGFNQQALWMAHGNVVNGIFADGHAEACGEVRLHSCSNQDLGSNTLGIRCWKTQDFRVVIR